MDMRSRHPGQLIPGLSARSVPHGVARFKVACPCSPVGSHEPTGLQQLMRVPGTVTAAAPGPPARARGHGARVAASVAVTFGLPAARGPHPVPSG